MSESHAGQHLGRVASNSEELKVFWEKRIQRHTQQLQSEDERMRRSALDRLRGEWAQKLEMRHRTLQTPPEATPRLS
ncbi:protein FAM240C [Molossus molossus]|uniref:protein FAM240C n=1 Tax=Molossus molossus TaxID=27622 RepID=UPI0017466397|nr:protein FAM240C [Molossus molossus]